LFTGFTQQSKHECLPKKNLCPSTPAQPWSKYHDLF
jgi:hypothetical protein